MFNQYFYVFLNSVNIGAGVSVAKFCNSHFNCLLYRMHE